MATVVEQIVVYEVHLCHSACSGETCDWRGIPAGWLYDEWAEAAADIDKLLTTLRPGCEAYVIVERDLMSRAAYDALPEVDTLHWP